MQTTVRIGNNYCIDSSELDALNEIQKKHSKAECAFYNAAIGKGWEVLRSGWPDYLIIKGKNIAFVEVKDGKDKLRRSQIKILNVLSGAGLNCFIWRPDTGFKKYKVNKITRSAETNNPAL